MTHPIQIQLPMGFPMGSVNTYLFPEPEATLVDTGLKTEACLKALEQGLQKHGLHISDLKRIVITHPHVDHFGLAGHIVAHSEAQVEIFEAAKSSISDYIALWEEKSPFYRTFFDSFGLTEAYYQPIPYSSSRLAQICDPIPAARIKSFAIGDTIPLGDKLWRVLHTPGHASDLTCFYQAETRQLLSSDALVPDTVAIPYIEWPPEGQTEPSPSLPLFLKSLDALGKLAVESAYPGHGPIFTNFYALIEHQKNYTHQRKEDAFNLIQSGLETVPALVNALYPKCPKRLLYAVLWNTFGYLDLLKFEERIKRVDLNGIWGFKIS